jgi:hypothetical protein
MVYSVYLKKLKLNKMKKLLLSAAIICFSMQIILAQTNANKTQNPLLLLDKESGKNTVNNSSLLKAGGDIIWQDDFSVANTWDITTTGQGAFEIGNTASVGTSNPDLITYLGAMATTGTTATNGYAFFDGIQYLLTAPPVVEIQNSSITSSTIDLSLYAQPSITLSFNQRFRHFNYDETYVEMSQDGGSTWVYSQQVNAGEATNGTSLQNNLSLIVPVLPSANTKIRFRWSSNSDSDDYGSGYGWMIDDVKLVEPYADEFTLTKVWTGDIVQKYDYYSTPLTQVIPMTVGAVISNMGGVSQAKVVSIEILQGTTSVYTATENITILPGVTDTLWHTSTFTPTANGVYTVKFTLPTDAINTNNTQSEDFEVTPNIYGHNFPITGTSFFGFNTVDAEIGMGNLYEINANQQLNGINVQFATGTTVSTEVRCELWEVLTNIQGDMNFITDVTYTVPSPLNIATPTTIAFSSPGQMEAGKLYMVILKTYQDATNKVRIRSSAKGDDDFSTIGYGPFATGGVVNYFSGWGKAPYISLNFDPTIGINESSTEISGVSIYPNPSSSSVNLEMNIANPSEVSIQVTDLSGKIVATQNLGFLPLGKNQTTIQSASFNNGLYYVTVLSNGTSVTKKFIKN